MNQLAEERSQSLAFEETKVSLNTQNETEVLYSDKKQESTIIKQLEDELRRVKKENKELKEALELQKKDKVEAVESIKEELKKKFEVFLDQAARNFS